MRITYEREAYEVAREQLSLPAQSRRGSLMLPEFGEHRRMLQGRVRIPVYSQELQELAPLSSLFERELNNFYNTLELEHGARSFSVSGGPRSGDLLPRSQAGAAILPHQSPAGNILPPPPRYSFDDFAPAPSYEQSPRDELLDYHYVTHL